MAVVIMDCEDTNRSFCFSSCHVFCQAEQMLAVILTLQSWLRVKRAKGRSTCSES